MRSSRSTPSVISLKKAMQTYARQGGTSAIFVHDDGLQLISAEEREKRIQFYSDHNIGWVARPPHSNDPEGYKRAGRFKKASNMNYGLALSLRMEKKLMELENQEKSGKAVFNGLSLEDRALEMAIEEIYEENGKKWKPWACNGKSLRMGDVILIVDSDTIVPEVSPKSATQGCQVNSRPFIRTVSGMLRGNSPSAQKLLSSNTNPVSSLSPLLDIPANLEHNL